MSISRELKNLQKEWKSSKARSTSKPVPDGNYIVRMIDSKVEKSKSSNRLQVAQTMQITEGKYKKRMVYRYSGIETQKNMSFFKADLKKISIKAPKSIINLTKATDKMVDMEIAITIKTNGEYTNIWFNGLAEDMADDEFEEEEEE